jgi:hypothetical protein
MLQSQQCFGVDGKRGFFSDYVRTRSFINYGGMFEMVPVAIMLSIACFAQHTCPRYPVGSVVQDPPAGVDSSEVSVASVDG